MTFCYFYYHVIAEYSGCCRISILIVLLLLLHFWLCVLCAVPYTPCKSYYVHSLRKNFAPRLSKLCAFVALPQTPF